MPSTGPPVSEATDKNLPPTGWGSLLAASVLVLATTIILRVSSCYESLWLDELHSAWSIWDGIEDVSSRARQGHQSPFYFLGLWGWKQVVGESEVALRLSSVLAIALGGIVLTVGVARWTRNLAAGLVAGMVLAIEENSLFFGTELRPYAAVVLFSCLAAVRFLSLTETRSRGESPRQWFMLIVWVLLATLCQPTTFGVLVWLLIGLGLVWITRDVRSCFRFNILDLVLASAVAATGMVMWMSTLGDSWAQRGNWASFATAKNAWQLWKIWDWLWLALIPLVLLIAGLALAGSRRSEVGRIAKGIALLALLAVAATASFWLISRAPWVPIWHRRFFIAVLPLLACVAGGSVGAFCAALPDRNRQRIAGGLAAVGLLIGLADEQGTLRRIGQYPSPMVVRGEDWRGAAEWIRVNTDESQVVHLDTGLIEAPTMLTGPSVTESDREYVRFPVRGPYPLERETVPVVGLQTIAPNRPGAAPMAVLTRRSSSRVDRSPWAEGTQVKGFGNISVLLEPE